MNFQQLKQRDSKLGRVPTNVPTVKTHIKTKAKAVRRRGENSLVIQITTTKPMIEMVDRIMDTGLFGTSRAAAAERIMCEGVRIILKENPFIRIKKILI